MAFAVWFVVSALVAARQDRLRPLDNAALLARRDARAGRRNLADPPYVPGPGLRHADGRDSLDHVAAPAALGWFFAVQHPGTPYWLFSAWPSSPASAAATSPPSCPRRASSSPSGSGHRTRPPGGIGTFGVSLVQFLTPWVIGFAIIGSTQVTSKGKDAGFQNAVLIWVPFVVFFAILAWCGWQPPRAGQRARAVGHLPRQAHLADDVTLRDDVRLLRRLRRNVPVDDQGSLWRLR